MGGLFVFHFIRRFIDDWNSSASIITKSQQGASKHEFDRPLSSRRFKVHLPFPRIGFKAVEFTEYQVQWPSWCSALRLPGKVILDFFVNISCEASVKEQVLMAEKNINAKGKWHSARQTYDRQQLTANE